MRTEERPVVGEPAVLTLTQEIFDTLKSYREVSPLVSSFLEKINPAVNTFPKPVFDFVIRQFYLTVLQSKDAHKNEILPIIEKYLAQPQVEVTLNKQPQPVKSKAKNEAFTYNIHAHIIKDEVIKSLEKHIVPFCLDRLFDDKYAVSVDEQLSPLFEHTANELRDTRNNYSFEQLNLTLKNLANQINSQMSHRIFHHPKAIEVYQMIANVNDAIKAHAKLVKPPISTMANNSILSQATRYIARFKQEKNVEFLSNHPLSQDLKDALSVKSKNLVKPYANANLQKILTLNFIVKCHKILKSDAYQSLSLAPKASIDNFLETLTSTKADLSLSILSALTKEFVVELNAKTEHKYTSHPLAKAMSNLSAQMDLDLDNIKKIGKPQVKQHLREQKFLKAKARVNAKAKPAFKGNIVIIKPVQTLEGKVKRLESALKGSQAELLSKDNPFARGVLFHFNTSFKTTAQIEAELRSQERNEFSSTPIRHKIKRRKR